MEMLEIKTTLTETKCAFNDLSRLDISSEERSKDISQTEIKKGQGRKIKKEQSIHKLWDNVKRYNMHMYLK